MILALIFSMMLMGHALADGLQGRLSAAKRSTDLRTRWIALLLHGGFHGLSVGIITASPLLAGMEVITHALIDRGKGRGLYGKWTDQALHVACKAVWIGMLAAGIVPL